MRIAICDDEENDLLEIKNAVLSFDYADAFDVHAFSNASLLLSSAEKQPFDIAILDIEMQPPNGFEVAKKLIALPTPPIVIFVTNSMEYTLRGYGVAIRYLTKPLSHEALFDALSVAIREANAKQFVFSMDGTSHIFRFEDIYYFEVFNHHMMLHTADQVFTFRGKLKDILAELPIGYFGAPHQSYLVNFEHIKTAMAKEIHLTNGEVIPVSRRKQHDFEKQLCTYLRR